ncbi:MAG: hypothetical protein ACK5AZ_20735 [Bryobacteraceae bacterium]
MHSLVRTVTLLTILSATSLAQPEALTIEAVESLERFASLPASTVEWERVVPPIAGEQANAQIAAVRVRNHETGVEMGGVRIRFASGEIRDAVWVPEALVEPLLDALAEVDDSARRIEPGVSNGCYGSCRFLSAMRAGAHFFYVSRCSTITGWSGLSAHTGRNTFRFTGLNAAAFRSALARAAEELQRR